MNCCIHCFSDLQLQAQIESLSNNTCGNCDFCSSTNSAIVDCGELADSFEELFLLYTPSKISPYLLHDHLQFYWKGLFHPRLDLKTIKQLVHAIGRASDIYTKELFESPVEFHSHIEDEGPKTLELQWDLFKKELIENNRFFIDSQKIDLELIHSLLSRLLKTYPTGTKFYRARIGNDKLDLNSLGKPPKELATSGRANPVGISYLYVSDSIETTIYETRSSLYDRLTVGTFELQAPLQVISLNKIEELGPFEIKEKQFNIEEFINMRPYLLKLQTELSKPIRKHDSTLDYLPTQYLCEFIKATWQAIEYKSAMHPGGYNLAVFDDSNMFCIDAAFIDITDLKYGYEPI